MKIAHYIILSTLFGCMSCDKELEPINYIYDAPNLISIQSYEFFPEIFLSKTNKGGVLAKPYIISNGSWLRLKKLHGISYGTYRFTILNKKQVPLALNVPYLNSSCRILENNKVLWEMGNPASSKKDAKAEIKTAIVELSPIQKSVITIEVADFETGYSGILRPLLIGSKFSLEKRRDRDMIIWVFISAIIISISIYSVATFIFNNKATQFLWFGIFSFFAVIWLLCSGPIPALTILSISNPVTLLNIKLGSFVLGFGFGSLYYLLPLKIQKARLSAKVILCASIVTLILHLTLERHAGAFAMVLFQGFAFISSLIGFVYMVSFIARKNNKQIWQFVGFVIFLVSFIHDLMVTNSIIHSNFWGIYGFLGFTITQFIYLLIRQSKIEKNLITARKQSEELAFLSQNQLSENRKIKDSLSSIKLNIADIQSIKFIDQILKSPYSDDYLSPKQKTILGNIKQFSDDFFERLEKEYPKLTPAEKELCTFMKIKLDSKGIAQLKGVNLNTVKVSKYRLRKKLFLPEGTDLYKFIDTI